MSAKIPFFGTYRRHGEGDFRCEEETVKRMLADQVEDARDTKLLEHFDFGNLNMPTLQAYRTAFKAVTPDHPWVDLDNDEFLRNIGGWTINRETKREGLTMAGLLIAHTVADSALQPSTPKHSRDHCVGVLTR